MYIVYTKKIGEAQRVQWVVPALVPQLGPSQPHTDVVRVSRHIRGGAGFGGCQLWYQQQGGFH